MIVPLIIGGIFCALGAVLTLSGASARDDLLSLGGLFVFVVGLLLVLMGAGVLSTPPECEEYGTIMVVVDGDKRCVPWEQAPDLQDFPQP